MYMKNALNSLTFFLNLKNSLSAFLHLLILFIIISLLFVHDFDINFNLKFQDYITQKLFNEKPKAANPDFVVIEIDDEAYNWLTKSYGSMRISCAKIIHILRTSTPRTIFVNFLFYGKGLSVEDLYLTAAVNSEFPIFFRSQLTDEGNYFTPLEAFSAQEPKFGFLSIKQSADKITRELKLHTFIKDFGEQFDIATQLTAINLSQDKYKIEAPRYNQQVISVSKEDAKQTLLPAASAASPVDYGQRIQYKKTKNSSSIFLSNDSAIFKIPLNRKDGIYLNYSYNRSNIKYINALDVINKKFDTNLFTNKIIIIDGTASVFQNNILTPIGTLPESAVLINAVDTILNKNFHTNILRERNVLSIIFIIISLIIIINFFSPLFFSFIFCFISAIASLFIFEKAFISGYYLPYGTIIISIILPFIYTFILSYIELNAQSRSIMKLASIDQLTGLFIFRYFCFLLQRAFIKQKNRDRNFYLAGIEFYLKQTLKRENLTSMDLHIVRDLGKEIKNFMKIKKIHGFSSDQNLCFIGFSKLPFTSFKDTLEAIRTSLLAILAKNNLEIDIRIAGIESLECKNVSSFHLVELLQFILTQKIKSDQNIIIYKPSELTTSIQVSNNDIPLDNDISYLSFQIKEDRKDLDNMKNRLKHSIQEYSMAQKFSAMGQLSSYYAHELKNPLHNLMSCFELLEDPGETEESRKEIKTLMKSELNRVIDLTINMGSHFKPSNENPSETNLNDVIHSCIKLLDRKFKNQNVKFIFEPDKTLPNLYLIQDQFKQVFLNLFLNSLDAMPNGGNIIINTIYTSPIVRINVTDTGTGIKPIDLERIFEAFYTTKKDKGGTGLGLFACYNIVRHHGGTLKATSYEGKGSTFEIILPT